MKDDPVDRLRAIIRTMPGVAVAYSGGVDSSLLLKVAVDELGDRTMVVIASTLLMPAGEVDAAVALAHTIGIEPDIVEIDLARTPEVLSNPPDRCYRCKKAVFGAIIDRAKARGITIVIDGSHAGDRPEDRPGMRALQELGVRSPLAEAGMNKAQIREAAASLGLEVAQRPASPCLATRFPFFEPITAEGLGQIDRAERFLRERGLQQVRVRRHGPTARIEVDPPDMAKVLSEREPILSALTGLGFKYVTMDLRGFRSGSMSEVLVSKTGRDEG